MASPFKFKIKIDGVEHQAELEVSVLDDIQSLFQQAKVNARLQEIEDWYGEGRVLPLQSPT